MQLNSHISYLLHCSGTVVSTVTASGFKTAIRYTFSPLKPFSDKAITLRYGLQAVLILISSNAFCDITLLNKYIFALQKQQ